MREQGQGACRLSQPEEPALHEHPNTDANIPGMFMIIPSMFVF